MSDKGFWQDQMSKVKAGKSPALTVEQQQEREKPELEMQDTELNEGGGIGLMDTAKAAASGIVGWAESTSEIVQTPEMRKGLSTLSPMLSLADYVPVIREALVSGKRQTQEQFLEVKDSLKSSMSLSAKKALEAELINDNLEFTDDATKLSTWIMKGTETIARMVPDLVGGGIVGKALYKEAYEIALTNGVAKGLTPEGAKIAANKIAGAAMMAPTAILSTTSAQGGAGVQVRETIENLSWKDLAQSETFKENFINVDADPKNESMSDKDKLNLARKLTAEKASSQIMQDPALLTTNALASFIGDATLGRIVAGKLSGGIASKALTGFAAEAPTEGAQGAMEQYAQNLTLIDIAGLDIEPSKGVAKAAAEGALLGGVIGGGIGAGGGVVDKITGRPSEPVDESPIQLEQELEAPEVIKDITTAERREALNKKIQSQRVDAGIGEVQEALKKEPSKTPEQLIYEAPQQGEVNEQLEKVDRSSMTVQERRNALNKNLELQRKAMAEKEAMQGNGPVQERLSRPASPTAIEMVINAKKESGPTPGELEFREQADIEYLKKAKDAKIPPAIKGSANASKMMNVGYRNAMSDLGGLSSRIGASTEPSPKTDTMSEAIAKMGGLSRSNAESEGFDSAMFKGNKTFSLKGDMSFDDAAEKLHELGFTNREGKQLDSNDVVEMIYGEANNEEAHYSNLVDAEMLTGDAQMVKAWAKQLGGTDKFSIAVNKALNNEPLGKRQAEVIEDMLETLNSMRNDRVGETKERLESARSERYNKRVSDFNQLMKDATGNDAHLVDAQAYSEMLNEIPDHYNEEQVILDELVSTAGDIDFEATTNIIEQYEAGKVSLPALLTKLSDISEERATTYEEAKPAIQKANKPTTQQPEGSDAKRVSPSEAAQGSTVGAEPVTEESLPKTEENLPYANVFQNTSDGRIARDRLIDAKKLVDASEKKLSKFKADGINTGVVEQNLKRQISMLNSMLDDAGLPKHVSSIYSADIKPEDIASDLAGEKVDKEWTSFAKETKTLNIPRSEMPQIKAEHRGALVNFMKGKGVTHENKTIPANTLKPTQAEFSQAKVKKAMDYEGGERSILISSDNYVLDGHHQWLAKRESGEEVKVIQLDSPIADLVKLAKDFPSADTQTGAGDNSLTDKGLATNEASEDLKIIEKIKGVIASRLQANKDAGIKKPSLKGVRADYIKAGLSNKVINDVLSRTDGYTDISALESDVKSSASQDKPNPVKAAESKFDELSKAINESKGSVESLMDVKGSNIDADIDEKLTDKDAEKIRGYMKSVKLYLQNKSTEPEGYNENDRDGGYRSALKFFGITKTESTDAIATEIIYDRKPAPNVSETLKKSESEENERVLSIVQKEVDSGLEIKNNNDLKVIGAKVFGIEKPSSVSALQLKIIQEAFETVSVAIRRKKINAVLGIGKGSLSSVKSAYDIAVNDYKSQPNLDVRTAKSSDLQAYSTPTPMALLANLSAGIDSNTTVYEPTAGNGLLLITANPKLTIANELDPVRASSLAWTGFNVTVKDATANDIGTKVDAVVANPPFGPMPKNEAGERPVVTFEDYRGKVVTLKEIDHVIAKSALDSMKDNGRATLIIGANMKEPGVYKGNQKAFLNWLYSNYSVKLHVEVDGSLYTGQGAGFPTQMIVIDGRVRTGTGKFAPINGLVKRVKSWSELYENFSDASLLSTESGKFNGRPKSNGTVYENVGVAAELRGDLPSDRVESRNDDLIAKRDGESGLIKSSGINGTRPVPIGKPSDGSVASQPDIKSTGLVGSSTILGGDAGTNGAIKKPNAVRLPAIAEAMPLKQSSKAAPKLISTKVDKANDFQAHYKTGSNGFNDGVLTPNNMASYTQSALADIQDRHGSVDQYVIDKLGYADASEMHSAFMGLQADSIALAVDNIESGRAIIIGDQTGVGKGRQAAGIIRYALKEGKTPIFISQKPNLFTDMYDDLADIGVSGFKPLIMNNDKGFVSKGGKKLFNHTDKERTKLLKRITKDGLPDGYTGLFLTYSQISSDKKGVKTGILDLLSENAILVMDESHTAAGQSKSGSIFKALVNKAFGVTYLSATYAKRPDNLMLYMRTDLGLATENQQSLLDAVTSGGLGMQTYIAGKLAEAGQMIRRERSFDGISINSRVIEDKTGKTAESFDKATTVLRTIQDISALWAEYVETELSDYIQQKHGLDTSVSGNQADKNINVTSFSSVVHNNIAQLSLGLKAREAGRMAIEAIKNGKRPVIALDNTLGSALQSYMSSNGLSIGDNASDMSYATVLRNALDGVLAYSVKEPGSDKGVKISMPVSKINSPLIQKLYKQAVKQIDVMANDNIPGSPIDAIRDEIVKAGKTVAEITGRNVMIDYADGNKIISRPAEELDRRLVVDKFNDGTLDVLIINQAGSTGLSIHASEKFKNKLPRHMIVAQPSLDINTFMQTLGRINRTGQVELPSYDNLWLSLPSEKRPAAVLSRKMSSLNANTSGNTESATSVASVDMLNPYGDKIIKEFSEANKDYLSQYSPKLISLPEEDTAVYFLGKLAVLPVKVQEEVLAIVEGEYKDLINYLDSTGQNELNMTELDLDAKPISQKVVAEGRKGAGVFSDPVRLTKVNAKAIGKSPTWDQVIEAKNGSSQKVFDDAIESAGKNTEYRRRLETRLSDLEQRLDEITREGKDTTSYENSVREATVRLSDYDSSVAEIKNLFGRGGIYSYGSFLNVVMAENEPTTPAVVIGLDYNHESGNPYAASKWKMKLMVSDRVAKLDMPLSLAKKGSVHGKRWDSEGMMETRFNIEASKPAREDRYVITGNLVEGQTLSRVKGLIKPITLADGRIIQAMVLPRSFDPSDDVSQKISVSSQQVSNWLIKTDKQNGMMGIANHDNSVVLRKHWRHEGSYVAEMPKSVSKGKIYWGDPSIEAVIGKQAVKGGGTLDVTLSEAEMKKFVKAMEGISPLSIKNQAQIKNYNELAGKKEKDFETKGILFNKTKKESTAVSKVKMKEADLIAKTFLKKHNGAAGISVDLIATQAEFLRRTGISEYKGKIFGGYVKAAQSRTGKGKVYLIVENFESAEDLRQTLAHEVVAHGGLDNVISGSDYNEFLNKISSTRGKADFKNAWDKVNKDYSGDTDAVKAEEVFALFVQNQPDSGPIKSWFNDLLNFVRRALEKVGILKANATLNAMEDMQAAIVQGFGSGKRTSPDSPPAKNNRLLSYSKESVDILRSNLEKEFNLTSLNIFESRDSLKLDTLIVSKEARGNGVGSKVMDRVIEYADQNSKRVILTPAVKDDFQGTTSRSRLVKFYKRFGFVENKGRKKDFTVNADAMYRDPLGIKFRREADNSEWSAENKILREQNKTIWQQGKNILKRNLSPEGLLPSGVFDEQVKRDNEFEAVEFMAKHLVSEFDKAVKSAYKSSFDYLPKSVKNKLSQALNGRVDQDIPNGVKAAIVAMRQSIDGLSNEYISNLLDKMARTMEVDGRVSEKDEALLTRISENIGSYVNRSYKAFDDPDWFKKVPTDTVNAARDYFVDRYIESGESESEARRLSDVVVNEILKTGTAYDSMESFVAEGKLGAKDLSILMRKKVIDPEIRALLGEYDDPRINYVKSATKMGRLVWNERFLDRVLDIGTGVFLFEGKNRPANATKQIAGEQSETYSPLNGLWTFPEVEQAFKDALGREQMSDLMRIIIRLNGAVKYGKTVLSPTTAARNFQSAMFFALANGHFDLSKVKQAMASVRTQVLGTATSEDINYFVKLKRIGVVYDTPYAKEMARLLKDSDIEGVLSSKVGDDGLKGFKRINDFAQSFYAFGDDFWKIIGFENEKASLIGAGMGVEAAELEAAKRTRNTYPTYSMTGKAIKALSRFPLAGTFVSFPAEIVRTSINMVKLVASDIKSENPKIRALGYKRMAGLAFVSSAFFALNAATKAMLGVTDDEEEAIRDLSAPWQKNSTFAYTGRDEKGNLQYFDMSFLDPYGYFKRPFTAMMRDQPWEDAAVSALSDLISPFLGADIVAQSLFEVMANKKSSGGFVYNDDASPDDQLADIAVHLGKTVAPGFVGNAVRINKALEGQVSSSGKPYKMEEEMLSLVGWRMSTIDPKTSLHYKTFEFTDGIRNANRTIMKKIQDANKVSDSDLFSAFDSAKKQHDKAFSKMIRLVNSAQSAGVNRSDIYQTLKRSGVSEVNAKMLLIGMTPRFTISKASAENAVKKAQYSLGDGQSNEVRDRAVKILSR